MKRFLLMFARHWAGDPAKLILTLIAVALGTGIVISSFNVSLLLRGEGDGRTSDRGTIMYIANGSWNGDNIERNRPSEWDMEALQLIVAESDAIARAVVVQTPRFRELMAGTTAYRLRSAIGTTPGYLKLFGLALVTGVEMTEQDVENGAKRVWISEEVANRIFGNAETAIGKSFQRQGSFGPGRNEDSEPAPLVHYRIAGVFETPSELTRRSYGVGDVIFPFTSLIPQGIPVRVAMDFMSGMFVVLSQDPSAERVEAEIRDILTASYGDDIELILWEGTPEGHSPYHAELRRTVDTFTITVNILGMIILLASSLGIFSIMVVESLNRRRERALERAMGASVKMVVWEFWRWSFMLSLAGALLGVIFAIILADPILATLEPIIGEFSGGPLMGRGVKPIALAGGVILTLLAGGVFGTLPALPTARENISETLREV